ncbi:uncharacterized protein LOC134814028 isoform X4 [Bolinopsis microptera]|uniref:uncharacterized protein LOC134814028 isoform X4 n=1 Tax=Bolinopsis microptera TaxID=2820187 RepID=UPI0030792194
MDLDLEGLYEDDGEEYDTIPCQLTSSVSSDQHHHSAPSLQKLPPQDRYRIHNVNSTPNLENDVNLGNTDLDPRRPFQNGSETLDGTRVTFAQNFGEEIYMNTSLHAEQKFTTPHYPVKYVSERQAINRPLSVTFKDDETNRPSPEEYYMVPPTVSGDANSNDHSTKIIAPDQLSHGTEEYSPGLYDAPTPLDINHATLPPLPPSANDPLIFYHQNSVINGIAHSEAAIAHSETQECFYEGINDVDTDCLYEGIPHDEDEENFYEGVGSPMNDFYEGIGDNDENDFYEGIGDDDDDDDNDIYEGIPDNNDVFYEGLGSPQEFNDIKEDDSLLNLIQSLTKSDTPYVPPKPPPVPMRNPSKTFTPLPDIPQNKELGSSSFVFAKKKNKGTVKKSPSLHGLTFNYSPVPQESIISKSKSLADMTSSYRSSTSPKFASVTSLSSDGLYDGIEMLSEDDEELAKDHDPEQESPESEYSGRRSYSVAVKKSVKKTKIKTAQQFEHLKETFTLSIKERKSKWKESKARLDLKVALKGTKTKASELAVNTESIYNSGIAAIQRRTSSKSGKGRQRSKTLPPADTERNKMSDGSIELEETFHSPDDFKSIQPAAGAAGGKPAVAGSVRSSKYYDPETSGGSASDHRSSMTSESRGRVQSMHSGISSNYHGDTSASAISSGEHSDSGGRVEMPLEHSLEEEGYAKMELHITAGAAAVASGGLPQYNDQFNEPLPNNQQEPRAMTVGSINSAPYTVSDRHRVLQQILDHEYRYIMSLKDIKKVYATPLQHTQAHKSLLDPVKAQEIFFRIPEITVHHEFFYEQLRRRSMTWSRHQLLGDILLQLFHKPGLFSAYASYIDNFNHTLEIVRDTRTTRPAFSKLLDKLRSKSNQMSLEDLLFLPVDHIPVYLELLKELIKQTTQDDPDYTYLYLAKDEIEKLIEKLTERKRQADKSFSVKLLEKKITGLPTSLIAPQRYIVSTERIRELDIMTDRSDERVMVVMSDVLLCLKPLSRNSNNVISTGSTAEYQYLWDCLITDVEISKESNESKSSLPEETQEESEGSQALKDDLYLLEQIDGLRMQLKGSYTNIRFDKLAEVQDKLKREIAERQSSEESRRGKTLDVTRPINSPCTSTQFHRFLFSSVAKRSTWSEDFTKRQAMMQHTKDLDWCQIGEKEVVPHERLSVLLPVIKHMTPIGLTTPSQFSVECAAVNADFTCPVTQDILYRIMSCGDKYESYANVKEADEIPILPPGAAPVQDTPVYDENLTPTLPPQSQPPTSQPQPSQPQPSSLEPPPLRQVPAVPSIMAPQSRSPFAINGTSSTLPSSIPPSLRTPPSPAARSQSYDSAVVMLRAQEQNNGQVDENGAAPPLPGNHPLRQNNLAVQRKNERQSIIEMIESVPKEFNMDDRETTEDLYETPYEISMLREEKRKLMRSMSVDENLLSSSSEILQTNEESEPSLEHSSTTQDSDFDLESSTEPFALGIPENIPEDLKDLPAGAIVSPLSRFEHLNLAEFPDESFNLELTDSREISSFIAPGRESLPRAAESTQGGPLLVDKYGQIYTDTITSLITGPVTMEPPVGNPVVDAVLPDFVDESLLELDSEDEDDTPNIYDSQLNLVSLKPSGPDSFTSSYSGGTPSNTSLDGTPVALPQIQVSTSEIVSEQNHTVTDSLYENFECATQKLRTKVIRRESSKRSINRGPKVSQSQISLASDDWLEQDTYENINEEGAEFELKSTDVFLCGHGQNGNGEIVVLRLAEPTPHIALDIPLKGSQVLCCHMVPGRENTLWVGTQDARLLVYMMSDPSSTLLELELDGGPVICISHIDDSVFVGTSEGYIHVFTRDVSVNEWCDNDPLTKKLGNNSICVMLPIGGQMWCSCGCQIFVISPENVTVEHLFSTHNNTSAQVYKMVNSGSGVWLAIRNSPVIRLFHAKTGEHLEDYDISTVVHHLFTGSHNSSRRRRAENVRVTALLASSSTGALWIGTSSGVVVVVPIAKPPVAPKICGPPFLSYMGHYDGVRFLMQAQSRIRKLIASESTDQENVYEEITSQVIISCGKGMEDFRDHSTGAANQSEHIQNSSYLIVWHYPASDENS